MGIMRTKHLLRQVFFIVEAKKIEAISPNLGV